MELPSYFKRYLRAIQPTANSRGRAVQLHNTLTRRLSEDEDFADWYDGTFLYGSYRRNTAVQPIKDVDVCVLLKLDLSRDDAPTPEAVVRRLRKVLDRNGYADKTALQRRSVRVDMSETTLDAVPVVDDSASDGSLLIPDRSLKEWVRTNPKGHLTAATALNKEMNGRHIPFVKIVKAWYRYQAKTLRGIERPKPKGFTLEALVVRYQDPDAPSYAQAFISWLEQLDADCGALLATGIFPSVPDPGIPGVNLHITIEADEAKGFGQIVSESLANAREALAKEQKRESAECWQAIFGPKFPVEPAAAKGRSFSTTVDDEDEDEDDGSTVRQLDLEVASVDLPEIPGRDVVTIRAELAKYNGAIPHERYPSDGRPLPKRSWIRFTVARTSITGPYSVRWIVTNHGQEAKRAHDLTHSASGPIQWESTSYRGSHTMTCEILRDGRILARSRHIINVGR